MAVSSSLRRVSRRPYVECLVNGSDGFAPRQFEYHPRMPDRMVVGTTRGEILFINPQSTTQKINRIRGKWFSPQRVPFLGLCWLKSTPSYILAGFFISYLFWNFFIFSFLLLGSDGGHVRLLNVDRMNEFSHGDPIVTEFPSFPSLTSVSANSSDEKFIVSGYSRDVGLYDINTGTLQTIFGSLHDRSHINVVKFSHLNPNCFVTSSFDTYIKFWDLRMGVTAEKPVYQQKSERGCVMVCFSEDDRYVLASAVDNLVTQVIHCIDFVDEKKHILFLSCAFSLSFSIYLSMCLFQPKQKFIFNSK